MLVKTNTEHRERERKREKEKRSVSSFSKFCASVNSQLDGLVLYSLVIRFYDTIYCNVMMMVMTSLFS